MNIVYFKSSKVLVFVISSSGSFIYHENQFHEACSFGKHIIIPTKNSKAIDLKLVIEEIPVMIQCIIIMKIKSDKIMSVTELVGNWVL